MKVSVVKRVLEANDKVAEENRKSFQASGVFAVNIISSPGSGKTTLLEKTIPSLLPDEKSMVIVGDLQTTRDAERVESKAVDVVQINTGMSCHLYANQVADSIKSLDLNSTDYVFIENVGNMVCPGEFDLGENAKVILYSIPEGDDKVAKYPTIFQAADLVLLTKIDLINVLDFDINRITEDIRKLNQTVPIIKISPKTGEGMDNWTAWLREMKIKSIGRKARFIAEL